MEKEQSDFGKGFTYCIGLFLMHSDRIQHDLEVYEKIGNKNRAYEMWFNGAADHLYDLQIPKNFKLKEDCSVWQDKCIRWRLCMNREKVGEKEFTWALKQAKKFLMEWDKQNGISVEEGSWE